MKKRLIVQRLNDEQAVSARVEQLNAWCQANKTNPDISLRVYTSQDDEKILVERWGFADSATETNFFASTVQELGPWPESDHADGHGDLMLFSEKEWDE